MLSKKYRATTEDVIQAVKKGSTIHTPYFSLRVSNQKEIPPRFSVVVSKKVASRAVERNTIKRRIRHAINPSTFPARKTFIIYVKKEALSAGIKQIQDALMSVAK